MDEVAPLGCSSVSPLSSSAMRADLLSEAWLRLRCEVVLRDVGLTLDGDGGFDPFLLLDVPWVGFEFLPLPRREPLCI